MLFADLKQSARRFRQAPGFTFAVVATLALGIAANTAVFSVIDTVLWKPYAYYEPERIVMFQNTYRQGIRSGSAAPVEFNWWGLQDAFSNVSAYTFSVANLTGEPDPLQIPIMRVSAHFFRLCGVNSKLGRIFTDADDAPGAPKTAVLAFGFWQRYLGGDDDVIGRRITLNGEAHEVIGVLTGDVENGLIAEQSLLSGSIEINHPPDIYVPLQLDPVSADRSHFLNVVGRLKPGVTVAAASAQLQASYREYERRWTDLFPGAGFAIAPLRDAIVGGVRHSLLILLVAVGLVLLIACVNVANLLLANAAGRRQEMAIRLAMGASRSRMIRQLLTENLMMSVGGSAAGLFAGYVGVRVLLALSPAIPRIGADGINVNLDWRVLGFTVVLSVLTTVLFGLAPALDASRTELSDALKEGGNRSSSTGRTRKTRALLVTIEIAMATVLLIGAGLLVRSFVAIRQVDPGFNATNVLTVRVSLAGPEFREPERVSQVIQEGIRRIRALPGVEAAATTCCVPLDTPIQAGFQIVGRPPGSSSEGLTGFAEVTDGFFETFQIPVLRGRAFTERDERALPTAIINETLARQFWPDGDPLTGQIVIGNRPPARIIGVAGDVHDNGLNLDPRPVVYLLSATPSGLAQLLPWAWVVRTSVHPRSVQSAIEGELRQASGGLPVASAQTMDEVLGRSTADEEFHTLGFAIFGVSALVLAAIGIFGLMADSVARRSHEIGVRLALGASPGHVRTLVMTQGLTLILLGTLGGVAAAVGLKRFIASLLFGVEPLDPVIFIAVPVGLVAIALAAVWIPARRASKVDPLKAFQRG
jgi:predicted permease